MEDGQLPTSTHKKLRNSRSYLHDKDCIILLQEYLREHIVKVDVPKLTEHINEQTLNNWMLTHDQEFRKIYNSMSSFAGYD